MRAPSGPLRGPVLNEALISRGEHAMKTLSFVLSLLLVAAPGFAAQQRQHEKGLDVP